jgi:hypothetical protein
MNRRPGSPQFIPSCVKTYAVGFSSLRKAAEMKMRAVHLWSLSLLLLAFNGCTQSPADQLKAELQTVTSWTATARMVGEAWLKGYLPRAYAARTLRTAQETISEEAKTIQGQSSEGVAELHTSLMSEAQSLEQLIGQMHEAVEYGDGSTLAPLLKQLEGEEQTVKALAKNGGVQP